MGGTGRIVVIGATGFTGRLVAEALTSGSPPADGPADAPADAPAVVLAGRDARKVAALADRLGGASAATVDVRDPASLAALIRAGDVVINCAGPFAELGEPVVARCVEAGASYVDTTGEQPWMREMRDRYHGPAQEAGVAVVNGLAFEWALGDCAAAVLATRLDEPLHALDVIYAWGGSASSRGTRRTSLRIIGSRGWELRDGRWGKRAAGASRRDVRFADGRVGSAVSFGAGEVVTVPRWADPSTARGWLVMSRRNAVLAGIVSPALPWLVPLLRPLVEPLVLRQDDPDEEERRSSVFTIRVEAATAAGAASAIEVHGADPYGLTAVIAVAGARRALAPGRASGVLAPSQLVEPKELLNRLAARGVRLVPER